VDRGRLQGRPQGLPGGSEEAGGLIYLIFALTK
jgi:hypothetical protein